MKIALIGRDIGYSQSGRVHEAIAATLGVPLVFDVCDVTYDRLEYAVKTLINDYDGFFVTKPYKNDVARIVSGGTGAVNVVRCCDKSTHNTDGDGFMYALERAFPGFDERVRSALILGAGGAAESATGALIKAGKKVYVLNRTLDRALKLTSKTGAELYYNEPAELVVNCTSVGRDGGDVLRSLCVLPTFDYAFDMTYGESTAFLRRCGAAGAKTASGDDMLVFQAILGDAIILRKNIDVVGVFDSVTTLLGGR